MSHEHKVVGYFAYRARHEVICTPPDACVITGSEEAMRGYVGEVQPGSLDKITIRKTRFGEIVQGMMAGGAYAFDEEAYLRFLPLARSLALPVEDSDFEGARRKGERFFTVRLLGSYVGG